MNCRFISPQKQPPPHLSTAPRAKSGSEERAEKVTFEERAGRGREGNDRRKKRSEGIRQRKKKAIRNERKSLRGRKKRTERRQRIRKPGG